MSQIEISDEELDKCIERMKENRYKDGWNEETWMEEMEKHPFFMKNAPSLNEELHPLVKGLQDLKYDPNENTPLELATKYKNDGDFYMKVKNFRMAVLCYSEAFKSKCDDTDLLAAIYNNRSAAHYFLKNYRSSLEDAKKCLNYRYDYSKACLRAAKCAFELNRFDLCIELCESLIEARSSYTESASDLLEKAEQKKSEFARKKRQDAVIDRKRVRQFQKLCAALKLKNVKFQGINLDKLSNGDVLKPRYLALEDYGVHLDDDGTTLVWPIVFLYPELETCDFSQQNSEDEQLITILNALFSDGPMTNKASDAYLVKNVNVYYENRFNRSVHKVDKLKTILEIVAEDQFVVVDGALSFFIVPMDSMAEKQFLDTYSKVF